MTVPMRDDVGAGLAYHCPRQPKIGSGWWETIWMVLTLPGYIRKTQPDVLYCAGNTYVVVAVAMKLLLRRACPRIVAKISNDLDRADQPRAARVAYRLWLRLQGAFIDRVVAMADPMVGEINEHLRIPSERIGRHSRPGALDGHDRNPSQCRPRAMHATSRPPLSGSRAACPAEERRAHAPRLPTRRRAPQDRLSIVGDGPERSKLETLAGRLGIDDRVTFCGYVADPTALFHGFDALLLSSNYEGVPAVRFRGHCPPI